MVKVSSSFIKSFMVKFVFKGTHTVIAYAQDLWIVVEIPFDFHSRMIRKGNVFYYPTVFLYLYISIVISHHRNTLHF